MMAKTEKTAGGSAHDETPLERTWWRRKRVWISALVLVLLVVIGVVVGAVYGVRNSKNEDLPSNYERLSAAQGSTSATAVPSAGYPTYTNSTYGTIRPPYPTSEPSPSPKPILEPQGVVPRDLSAAIGAPSLLLWDLRADGNLWKKEVGGSWEAYTNIQFLVAPVTVSTGEGTQTAVAVEKTNGHMVYMHFRDGKWDDWQELNFAAEFGRRPSVISREQGKIDIFNVDYSGHLWLVSYDGLAWSKWTDLGDGINGDVAATSWGSDRIDVFAKYGDITNAPVRHRYWTAESDWSREWEDLGIPYQSGWDSSPRPGVGRISSPLASSWCNSGGDCVIDVVINAGSSSHKIFQNGGWSDWIGMSASHEGLEFPDTQSIARGDGIDGRPFAHIISRGTDNCVHHIAHNGTGWGSWTYLWCESGTVAEVDYPTEFLPTFVTSSVGGNVEVLVRDLGGSVFKYDFIGKPADWVYLDYNKKWENLGKPE